MEKRKRGPDSVGRNRDREKERERKGGALMATENAVSIIVGGWFE